MKTSLSASALKHLLRSPEHYVHYRTKPQEDTDAMNFGRALHCIVLQPKLFTEQFFVYDPNNRPVPESTFAKKENKEWKAEQFLIAGKKDVVTKEEYDLAQRMRDKLMATSQALELINYTRAEYEVKYRWNRRGIVFNGFIDIDADIFFCDLKTCQNADPNEFQRDIFKMRYDIQGACYSDARAGGKMQFGTHDPFYLIAIEKAAPYGVSVHLLGMDVMDKAFSDYLDAIDLFKNCLQNKDWPGYEIKAPVEIDGVSNDGIFPTYRPSWIK